MAKKMKGEKAVTSVVGILATVAVGGLFLDGTTIANPLLSFLPEVVHTITGWIVIAGGALQGIRSLK